MRLLFSSILLTLLLVTTVKAESTYFTLPVENPETASLYSFRPATTSKCIFEQIRPNTWKCDNKYYKIILRFHDNTYKLSIRERK